MSIEEKTLEYWAVEKFIDYASNPRKNDHAVDAVAAAIREFGFRVPVVAKSDGTVVDGHLRLKAAKKLELESITVLLADDLTDTQIKAFRISVNQVASIADWDLDLLKLEIEGLEELEFDIDLLGFDKDFLNELIEEEPGDGLTDEDACPEPPGKPVSVLGDVWRLGEHRVMCGDSTSIDAVEKLMDGLRANMLHTDPPYNVAYEGKTKDSLTIKNDHLAADEFQQFLTDALTCAYSVLHDGSNIYVWHADIVALEFITAFRQSGFRQAKPSTIQWVKDQLVLSQGDYHSQNEPCLYGWKEGKGRVRVADRKQTTVWNCPKPKESKVHPTMKPVELCERAILNSSMPNTIILDLFGGGGSTLIACEKTNRNCYMMELDEKYVDVIIKRWQDFTGKEAIHADTGLTYKQTAEGLHINVGGEQ